MAEKTKTKRGNVSGRASKRKKFLWIYFAAAGIVYLFAIFLFAGTKVPVYDLVLFIVMTAVNFSILGYSVKIKNPKARKKVFAGTIIILAGFVFYYLFNVFQSNPSLAGILGFPVDMFMTAGYLFLLFGLKGEMK